MTKHNFWKINRSMYKSENDTDALGKKLQLVL